MVDPNLGLMLRVFFFFFVITGGGVDLGFVLVLMLFLVPFSAWFGNCCYEFAH